MVATITTSDGSNDIITTPAGWTMRQSDINGTDLRTSIYTKTWASGDPATANFTFNGSRYAVGGMVAYSGVDTTNPIEAMSGRNWGDFIGGAANTVRGARNAATGYTISGMGALGCAACAAAGYAYAAAGVAKVRTGLLQVRRGTRRCARYCSARQQLQHAMQEQIPLVGDRIRCRRGGC